MELYLSTKGNDNANGSIDEPIKSIPEVLNRIKNSDEDVVVHLMEGVYRIEESIVLEGMKNITFRSYGESKVCISGAKELTFDNLDENDREIFKNNPYIEKIKVAKLNKKVSQSAYGDAIPFGIGFPIVLKNGNPIEISRFPKDKYLKAKNVNGKQFSCEETKDFVFEEMWYFGYPRWEWSDLVCSVEKNGSTFELERESWSPLSEDSNYYFMNTADNLMENEWVISFKNNKIYFCGDAEKIEFPYFEEAFVKTVDCENVTFEDITFEMTRGNGVENIRGKNVCYKNCTFQYISGSAVVFGLNDTPEGYYYGYMGDGGVNSGIENCRIYYTGTGGAYIAGGDRDTLTRCGNYVKDCDIEKFSVLATTYRPGVRLSGVGCKAIGNKIHDASHMGLGYEGNEHIIEGNEIYDVLKFSDDAAAIYTGNDWTACGTVIRNNYIHHITSGIGEHGTFAIYIDDCSGTTEICGNYFEGVPCAFCLHGGRNMNVHDNVIKDSDKAFLLLHHHPDLVEKNRKILIERMKRINISNKAWDKYSMIRDIPEDEPMEPKYNRVYNNVLIKTPFGSVDESVEVNGEIDKGFCMAGNQA